MAKNSAYEQAKAHLPNEPGIYRYYDNEGLLLYVGKAKNLKKRVSSYFNREKYDSARIKMLTRNTARIEYVIVGSETDAFLLENQLIKQHQPKYNIQLKDDKTYPYICIKKEPYPRVFLTRMLIKDGSEYLGPYTSVVRTRAILELIKTLFPIRSCRLNLNEKNVTTNKFKVCLEYHIGNCKGPCQNFQSFEDYNAEVQQIRNVLKGKFGIVKDYFKKQMEQYSKDLEFEKAADIKKKLAQLGSHQIKSTVVNAKLNDLDVFAMEKQDETAFVSYLNVSNGAIISTRMIEVKAKLDESDKQLIEYAIAEVMSQKQYKALELIVPEMVDYPNEDTIITVPKIGDKKKLLELAQKNVKYYKLNALKHKEANQRTDHAKRILAQLHDDLRLNQLPVHIECFDNSNFQGSFPVASMVVFKNGKAAKKEYRHYNIKTVEGPDDYASMEEIVFRRYNRMLEENQSLPQIVLIDGGKGQLSSAMKSINKLGLNGRVTVIGIAKQLEQLFFPEDTEAFYIDKRSESLKLLQNLRNEAHRFAINFHRTKRSQEFTTNELERINGIGQKTADTLLVHFKSVKKVREASPRELRALIGKSKAEIVVNYFEENKPENEQKSGKAK